MRVRKGPAGQVRRPPRGRGSDQAGRRGAGAVVEHQRDLGIPTVLEPQPGRVQPAVEGVEHHPGDRPRRSDLEAGRSKASIDRGAREVGVGEGGGHRGGAAYVSGRRTGLVGAAAPRAVGWSSMIEAAGGVVWKVTPKGVVKVLLVHRPRYDDWSFPKGKLDPGERHRPGRSP